MTNPAIPANMGSASRIRAARLGGMRRCPHTCNGSATAEHAIPVNDDGEHRERGERADALPPRWAGRTATATMPSCMPVNAAGGMRRT